MRLYCRAIPDCHGNKPYVQGEVVLWVKVTGYSLLINYS